MPATSATNQFKTSRRSDHGPESAPTGQPAGTLPVGARVAQNLAHYRQLGGLTQQQLAIAAHISRATVNLIESGQGDPRLSTVELLATALGVDATDLTACRPSAAQ